MFEITEVFIVFNIYKIEYAKINDCNIPNGIHAKRSLIAVGKQT